ncbi:MAG: DUF4394 domain-containing protein, partial [Rhodospirillales bacterium]
QATAARLLGIDLRPADLKLYGLDAAGGIYRIDARTGMTERVSTLSVPLEIAESAVVDFNPQANRLRVIGPSGQSLRVNVETGETAVDGRIAYAEGDANAGKLPLVTAAAYLNSVAGTTQTQLFDFDSGHGFYAIQDPPNAGTLNSIAPLGLPAESRIDAADIHTDKSMMVYKSFAVVANRLFSFAVASGRMTDIGPIAAGSRKIVDIAVVSPP